MPNLNNPSRYTCVQPDYAGEEIRIMCRILREHEKLHPKSPLPQGVKITPEGRVEIDPHEVIRGHILDVTKNV
jgi:hypothetical protein